MIMVFLIRFATYPLTIKLIPLPIPLTSLININLYYIKGIGDRGDIIGKIASLYRGTHITNLFPISLYPLSPYPPIPLSHKPYVSWLSSGNGGLSPRQSPIPPYYQVGPIT